MILNDVYDDCNVPIINLICPSPPRPQCEEETRTPTLQVQRTCDILVRSASGTVWPCRKSKLIQASSKLAAMVHSVASADVMMIPEEDFLVEAILRWTHCTGLVAEKPQTLRDPRETLAKLFAVAREYQIASAMYTLRWELDSTFICANPVAALVLSIRYGFERERRAAEAECFFTPLPPEDEVDADMWKSLSSEQQKPVIALRAARTKAIMKSMEQFLNAHLIWTCGCSDFDDSRGRSWPLGWKRWHNRSRREVRAAPVLSNICGRKFAQQCMKDSRCPGCIRAFSLILSTNGKRLGDEMLDKFWSLCKSLPSAYDRTS